MASISLTDPVAATTVTAGLHAGNNAALRTAINGGLDNTNIAGGAAIDQTKLAFTAWTAYTPAWTSTGVAPVINNGTLTGKYAQLGKLVQGRALITIGAATTVGTGTYSISLPVVAAAAETLNLAIGVASFYDSSATQLYHMFSRLATTTTVVLDNPVQPSSVTVSATTPVVPAVSDLISVKFAYEAA